MNDAYLVSQIAAAIAVVFMLIGLSEDAKRLLEAKSHKLTPFGWHARPQTVLYKDGWVYGYTDERRPGGGAYPATHDC